MHKVRMVEHHRLLLLLLAGTVTSSTSSTASGGGGAGRGGVQVRESKYNEALAKKYLHFSMAAYCKESSILNWNCDDCKSASSKFVSPLSNTSRL